MLIFKEYSYYYYYLEFSNSLNEILLQSMLYWTEFFNEIWKVIADET